MPVNLAVNGLVRTMPGRSQRNSLPRPSISTHLTTISSGIGGCPIAVNRRQGVYEPIGSDLVRYQTRPHSPLRVRRENIIFCRHRRMALVSALGVASHQG
jgi:hypothetical protein